MNEKSFIDLILNSYMVACYLGFKNTLSILLCCKSIYEKSNEIWKFKCMIEFPFSPYFTSWKSSEMYLALTKKFIMLYSAGHIVQEMYEICKTNTQILKKCSGREGLEFFEIAIKSKYLAVWRIDYEKFKIEYSNDKEKTIRKNKRHIPKEIYEDPDDRITRTARCFVIDLEKIKPLFNDYTFEQRDTEPVTVYSINVSARVK